MPRARHRSSPTPEEAHSRVSSSLAAKRVPEHSPDLTRFGGSLLRAPFLSQPRFSWKQPPGAETLDCLPPPLAPLWSHPPPNPTPTANEPCHPPHAPLRRAFFKTASGFSGLSRRETEGWLLHLSLAPSPRRSPRQTQARLRKNPVVGGRGNATPGLWRVWQSFGNASASPTGIFFAS